MIAIDNVVEAALQAGRGGALKGIASAQGMGSKRVREEPVLDILKCRRLIMNRSKRVPTSGPASAIAWHRCSA